MGEGRVRGLPERHRGNPSGDGERTTGSLIEDIAGAIARSGAGGNSENKGIEFFFQIVREAVYRRFPENGPDDIWKERDPGPALQAWR